MAINPRDPNLKKYRTYVRSQNDTWVRVGQADNPIRIRKPDGSWGIYGDGTGAPLFCWFYDEWILISREGLGYWWVGFTANYLENDLFMPTGWFQRHVDYTSDVYGRNVYDEGNAVLFPGSVRSFSHTGYNYDFFLLNREQRMQLDYGWYVFDLDIINQVARAKILENPFWIGMPQQGFTDLALDHVDVNASLKGYSRQYDGHPTSSDYRSHYVRDLDGVGSLFYQGHTAQSDGPYTWTKHLPNQSTETYGPFPTVKAVRNKLAAPESGAYVWTGSLNSLGENNWVSAPVHTLTGADMTGGIQYHWNVSRPPDPAPDSPGLERTFDNLFAVEMSCTLWYRYLPVQGVGF
jgi:hypothetical protein